MNVISPNELLCRLGEVGAAKIGLLDVRTPGEFEGAYVAGARLHPSDGFDPEVVGAEFSRDQEIVMICQKGPRAVASAEKLEKAGFENLRILEGGMAAWSSEGLATEGGSGAIGMDRQMRIVAGSLALLGVALGTWVSAGWYGLSAFVGAGLIFAGVTDCCPMTSLLAVMPWNRGGSIAAKAMLSSAEGSGEACCSPGGG